MKTDMKTDMKKIQLLNVFNKNITVPWDVYGFNL